MFEAPPSATSFIVVSRECDRRDEDGRRTREMEATGCRLDAYIMVKIHYVPKKSYRSTLK